MPPKRPPTKLVDPKKWNGVPSVLKLLLVKLAACLAECARGNAKRDVDLVEIFAGERALTFTVQNQGYVAEGCDILLDPALHDILLDEGVKYLCKLVLRIKPGGVCGVYCPAKLGSGYLEMALAVMFRILVASPMFPESPRQTNKLSTLWLWQHWPT